MKIRRATVFDFSFILALLAQMHKEAEFELSSIDPIKFSESVLSTINSGVVFVAEEDNRIIGSIGGIFSSDWWSSEIYLGDRWFYVYKKERKSRAAYMLVKEFIKAAKKSNMQLRLAHIFSGDIDRKDKFYDRLGLRKAGSHYVMEEDHGS